MLITMLLLFFASAENPTTNYSCQFDLNGTFFFIPALPNQEGQVYAPVQKRTTVIHPKIHPLPLQDTQF